MRAQAFVIHLAEATARRPQVDALLQAVPLPASVVQGVNGRALSLRAIDAVYARALLRPRYPFALRPTEIGCFLSHRKAWQAILSSGLDAGLIVEDDVALDEPSFGSALALALRAGQPSDYIRFPYRSHTDKGAVLAGSHDVRLIAPSLPGAGMQAQLVGREAAARLIACTQRFDRPVDSLIQMRWQTGVRTLAVQPSGVREIGGSLGGTLVQKKAKPLPEVVLREVSRALYRTRLRLSAMSHPLAAGGPVP